MRSQEATLQSFSVTESTSFTDQLAAEATDIKAASVTAVSLCAFAKASPLDNLSSWVWSSLDIQEPTLHSLVEKKWQFSYWVEIQAVGLKVVS